MKSKKQLKIRDTSNPRNERITTQLGGRNKSSGYDSGSPELVDPPVQYLQEVTLSSRQRVPRGEEEQALARGPEKFVLEFNTPSLFERYNKVIMKSFGAE